MREPCVSDLAFAIAAAYTLDTVCPGTGERTASQVKEGISKLGINTAYSWKTLDFVFLLHEEYLHCWCLTTDSYTEIPQAVYAMYNNSLVLKVLEAKRILLKSQKMPCGGSASCS